MLAMERKAWSPYVAGIVIGLLQIPAFLLIDTALGASSAFVTIGGTLAAAFDPAIREGTYFTKYLTRDTYVWQAALLVGIVLGAFASSRAGRTKRAPFSAIWTRAVGIRTLPARMAMGFTGGFLLLFGARLAGGCTSGHGISGSAQLAVASLVAVIAMFAGGILVANLMRKV